MIARRVIVDWRGPAVACLVLAPLVNTPVLGQGIVGSSHDFSSAVWNPSRGFCLVCHTPGEPDEPDERPQWNHALTSATFDVYRGTRTDARDLAAPGGVSKLCLSCHDGITAVDSYGGDTGFLQMTGAADLGTDLRDDHPVSFRYDDDLARRDGGLKMPSTDLSGLGGTIRDDLLIGNMVQCGSCHDPHNGGPTSEAFMLRRSNTGSSLCLTCHQK